MIMTDRTKVTGAGAVESEENARLSKHKKRGRPKGVTGLAGRRWVERDYAVYSFIFGPAESREDLFNDALYGLGSEKRLLVAILARAILDLTVSGARVGFAGNSGKHDVSKCGSVRAIRRSAWHWFYSMGEEEWSYRWVCQHVNLSPSYIVEQLEKEGLLGGACYDFPQVTREFQQVLMQAASIS
jgi:hypothetical protein